MYSHALPPPPPPSAACATVAEADSSVGVNANPDVDVGLPPPPPPPPPPPVTGEGDTGAEEPVMDPDQQRAMMEMLGLPVGFDSTSGKKVDGADVSGKKVVKERKFRQYMNRFGGFSRPLDAD